MLESPIIGLLALATSIVFTFIAAMVPPNAGNFVAALFLSSMASFVGGEDEESEEDLELADADI